MSTILQAVQIPELAYGDDCIRIDWIGDVKPQVYKQDRPAFHLEVLVSVCEGGRGHSIRKDIPQRLIQISVDALPSIWNGSLWKNGRRLSSPGYLRTRTAEISFTVGTEKWVSLEGNKTADNKFDRPISKSEIPILRQTIDGISSGFWQHIKNSQLLEICWDSENPNVLIPAIELARFYACMSSVLSRNLFAGDWSKLEYPPHSCEQVVDGLAKIGVDNLKGMDRLSAVAIARYKFSSGMKLQVDRAGQALSYPARRKDPFHFGFPFDQLGRKAKIVCDVVDFQKFDVQSNRYKTHHLVTHIRYCFEPLPFDSLNVEFKVSPEQRDVEDPALLKPIALGPRPVNPTKEPKTPNDGPKVNPTDPTSVSIEPDVPNAIAEVTSFIDQQDRFAAFNYEKVKLISTKTEQTHKSGNKLPVEGGIGDGVSTNPGKGSKGKNTEAQINTNNTESTDSEPVTLQSFYDALVLLKDDSEFSMVIKSVNTKIDDAKMQFRFGNFYVMPLRNFAKTRSKWHGTSTDLNRTKSSKSRSRYLLMALVVFRNGAQYLIGEIERVKPGDKFSIFCAQILAKENKSFGDLAIEVAQVVAASHGWPKYDAESSVYSLAKTTIPARRLIHSGSLNSANEYALRIANLESGKSLLASTRKRDRKHLSAS